MNRSFFHPSVFLLLLALPVAAEAGSYTWNASSGLWGVATNWSPATVPGTASTDVACFTNTTGTATLDGNYTLGSIVGNTSGGIQSSGSYTLTLTAGTCLNYSGASTSGFVQVTGGSLVISGGTGLAVLSSSSGYAIVPSSTAALSVMVTTGTACMATNGGRAISRATGAGAISISTSGGYLGVVNGTNSIAINDGGTGLNNAMSSGTLSIVGGSSPTLFQTAGSCAWTLTNVVPTSTITNASGIFTNGAGTINCVNPGFGNFQAGQYEYRDSGGLLAFSGTSSIPAGIDGTVYNPSGLVSLNSWTLSCSGSFLLWKVSSGSVTSNNSTLTLAASNAAIACLGQSVSATYSAPVKGPLLPSGSNVLSASPPYGYASALISGSATAGATVTFSDGSTSLTNGTLSATGGTGMLGGSNLHYTCTLSTGTLTAGNLLTSNSLNLGGTVYNGTLTLPPGGYVYSQGTVGAFGVSGSGTVATLTLPAPYDVIQGTGSYGVSGTAYSGTYYQLASVGDILAGQRFGPSQTYTGTLTLPTGSNVWAGQGNFGVSGTGTVPTLSITPSTVVTQAGLGTIFVPSGSDVWTGIPTGSSWGSITVTPSLLLTAGTVHGVAGTFWVPNGSGTASSTMDNNAVKWGVRYGPGGSNTGAYAGHGPFRAVPDAKGKKLRVTIKDGNIEIEEDR